MPEKCEWIIRKNANSTRSDFYTTGCKMLFRLLGGPLSENNFKFCPYCGKVIEVVG